MLVMLFLCYFALHFFPIMAIIIIIVLLVVESAFNLDGVVIEIRWNQDRQ